MSESNPSDPIKGEIAEPLAEAWGPQGDEARHLPLDALLDGLATLPDPPSDRGTLARIVRRRADGVREEPERIRLTLDEGVPGDGWRRRPPMDPVAQLAVIREDIAALLANDQPVNLAGDNLYVDLDLAANNLPFGTRLRVGEAVVEMTPKAHNGCHKFRARFGDAALRFVAEKTTRPENRRGVYWRVIEEGAVVVGDTIEVLSR
jgi:MOSC domain-containing protein YiiM